MNRIGIVALVAFGLLVSAPISADLVSAYESDVALVNWTGSINEGEGLSTFGEWANDDVQQSISWIITEEDGNWTYQYSFSGFASPTVSHFILDVSDSALEGGQIAEGAIEGDYNLQAPPPGGWMGAPGNPGTDGLFEFGGVKFDEGSDVPDFSISFVSDRDPIWGNIYVKGGNYWAYNAGLAGLPDDESGFFIPTPDSGIPPVPEPATLLLIGAGLAGLGLVRRKR